MACDVVDAFCSQMEQMGYNGEQIREQLETAITHRTAYKGEETT
jgi:hypothetical protein